MKIKTTKVINIEKYQCEICGKLLEQNGDGTLIYRKSVTTPRNPNEDYAYTLHTSCLVEFLDKLLTSNN